jgi:mono/diheme cytochrome c family protein
MPLRASVVRTLGATALMTGLLGCGKPDLGVPPQVCSTRAVAAGESELMEPGGSCINCHGTYEGPSFAIAGSVMNALHDDTNCAGIAGVTVAITGADGMRVELQSNENGNFTLAQWPGPNLFPYSAEISRDGVTTKMLTPRQAGENDCNSCHTPAGLNLAPGRIVPP